MNTASSGTDQSGRADSPQRALRRLAHLLARLAAAEVMTTANGGSGFTLTDKRQMTDFQFEENRE